MVKLANKQSKRQPARQRYKIEKKIRQHNKKARREAKKNPKKGNKQKIIQVPNICPFKEDILREVEALKQQKEEERLKLREAAKLERQRKKEEKTNGQQNLVNSDETPELEKNEVKKRGSYVKDYKEIIETSDIVLEILDARDPLGTRYPQAEQIVKKLKNKQLIIILNKSDLVPREVLEKWLKHFRKTNITVPFKASTQQKNIKNGKSVKLFESIGNELLMNLLHNYFESKNLKKPLRIGIIGVPNVGKKSLINSLKTIKASEPGINEDIQEVQLDSKIILLDSPGLIPLINIENNVSLLNPQKIRQLHDPISVANSILDKTSKEYMMEMYDIHAYETPEEFYNLKATRTGRFKKGRVPDTIAAAKGLLEDWNSGKIKYYTLPPEDGKKQTKIGANLAKQFSVSSLESMETSVLKSFEKNFDSKFKFFVIDSLGPLSSAEDMNNCNRNTDVPTDAIPEVTVSEKEKKKANIDTKLNKVKKPAFKKDKKEKVTKEKVSKQLSSGLENYNVCRRNSTDETYDFDTDFNL
ncbi:guanine nucleotide-binding protein-like 3 homolog [Aethina tumida]|uniref:guanine nucleotide-binding protein-like 3 homolog n=1 Tax=Aethina tumida TaxID=116153 RepID=UPI002149209B|nr:guanine nucleotide-binding protein-like 3 homolog [Aethina tumida]